MPSQQDLAHQAQIGNSKLSQQTAKVELAAAKVIADALKPAVKAANKGK